MAAPISANRVLRLCEVLQRHQYVLHQSFSVTAVPCVGRRWRLQRGMAADGVRYGPLTDLPDYSFIDGRPTPLSKGQLRRQNERIEMAAHVVKLLEEVDFAKENYARKQRNKEQAAQKMLESKLKAKVDDKERPVGGRR